MLGSQTGADLGWKFPLGVHLSIPASPHWPGPAPGAGGSQVPCPLPGAGSAAGTRCHARSQSDPNLCEGQGEQGLCLCRGLGELGSPRARAPGNRRGGKAVLRESAGDEGLGRGRQQGGTGFSGHDWWQKARLASRCDSWCPRFPESSHVLPGTSPDSSCGRERVASRSRGGARWVLRDLRGRCDGEEPPSCSCSCSSCPVCPGVEAGPAAPRSLFRRAKGRNTSLS